jgi:hypothetical protein
MHCMWISQCLCFLKPSTGAQLNTEHNHGLYKPTQSRTIAWQLTLLSALQFSLQQNCTPYSRWHPLTHAHRWQPSLYYAQFQIKKNCLCNALLCCCIGNYGNITKVQENLFLVTRCYKFEFSQSYCMSWFSLIHYNFPLKKLLHLYAITTDEECMAYYKRLLICPLLCSVSSYLSLSVLSFQYKNTWSDTKKTRLCL